MTRTDISEILKGWGIETRFKPVRAADDEREVWLLEVKEGQILVDLATKCLRVWTERTRLGRTIAAEFGLKAREFTGEIEVFVPPALADIVLPRFGARVRRGTNDRQRKALAEGRRNSPVYNSVHG